MAAPIIIAAGKAIMSPMGLKLGIGAAVLIGAWWWHTGQIREAKQEAAAETRSTVQTELEAQHAIETKKYEERVAELEQRVVDLAKNRAASVQRIEVITKQAELERAELPTLTDDAVIAAIRERLRANTATATNSR